MLLFVGLGNPGRAHAGQRHNIGFMVADAIADAYRCPPFRPRFAGQATEATIAADRLIILKPETYMNESGRAVGDAVRFYKIAVADVTVFHDELDLAPGKVRVKTGGGNAGHNGLRSISDHIGNEYRRVRLGIGHPGDKALVHNFVLGQFAKADAAWVEGLCKAVAANAADLVRRNDSNFQTRVHTAIEPLLGA